MQDPIRELYIDLMKKAGYSQIEDEHLIFTKGSARVQVIADIADECLLIGCLPITYNTFLFDSYRHQDLDGEFGEYLKNIEVRCSKLKIVGLRRDNPSDNHIYYTRLIVTKSVDQCESRLRITDKALLSRLDTLLRLEDSNKVVFDNLIYPDVDIETDPQKFEAWLDLQLEPIFLSMA
jgi:hypothetical protein